MVNRQVCDLRISGKLIPKGSSSSKHMKKPPKSNPWWKFSHFDMVLSKPEVRSPHRKRISEASFRRTTCQFYFWHRNTSSVFSVDEIRSSFGAFLKMSTCLRLFLEVQQCQLEPIFGFWGHEVWRIGLQLHSVPRFKHCWTYKKINVV